MIKNVYSIYDDKAGVYLTPFFMLKHGEAMRAFSDAVEDPKTTINRHPGDYKLYFMGTFDDVSGVFHGEKNNLYLSIGTDYKVVMKGENKDVNK